MTPRSQTAQTAIILGGGPTGCFTALTLANIGYTTTIYEIRPEPAVTVGGGVNLSPNCIRILQKIGLADKIIAAGWKCDRIVMRNARGQTLGIAEDGVESKYGYPMVMIRRMRFLRILLDAVKEKGIPIHYSKKATSISETSSDVTVTFEDTTTATASILLGCDGIHSFTRTHHVAPQISETYTGVAASFQFLNKSTMDPLPSLPGDVTGHFGAEGFVGMVRSAPEEIFWMVNSQQPLKSREGWKEDHPTAVRDKLLAKFGHWASPVPEVINAATEEMYWYPIHKLDITSDPTYTWHTPRTLLLGDAAHAMPPHAGQGTAMGFEDAVMLGRVLEKYPAWEYEDVFQKVYEVRVPRVREVLATAEKRGGERREVYWWVAYLREWVVWAFLSLKDKKALDPVVQYDVYKVDV
ncbi:hypothetical protein HK097_000356 [Rhizophlyctis rosea]|uniref:FAD-binding domain-containing protein n=1 Tax=Rhizophlyctis rosea TaxID=64517 RepID=A0AAD5X1I2_9FUNG|nr:hypothetical protein HK097_000356 [Rhizophlyctis rosea]